MKSLFCIIVFVLSFEAYAKEGCNVFIETHGDEEALKLVSKHLIRKGYSISETASEADIELDALAYCTEIDESCSAIVDVEERLEFGVRTKSFRVMSEPMYGKPSAMKSLQKALRKLEACNQFDFFN